MTQDNGAWCDWAGRAERAARNLRAPHASEANMRASDAERSAVADQLSAHFGAGRLDQAEFDERLSRAMAAKTRGELGPLLADLPSLDAAPVPVRRHGIGRVLLLAVAFLILANAVTHAFWWGHAWFPFGWLPFLLVAFLLLRLTGRRRHRSRP